MSTESKQHSRAQDIEDAFAVLDKKHHPTWEIECVQATAELRAHFASLEEQVDAMQRELEQWSVGLGPGPERMKELREAQRGR